MEATVVCPNCGGESEVTDLHECNPEEEFEHLCNCCGCALMVTLQYDPRLTARLVDESDYEN